MCSSSEEPPELESERSLNSSARLLYLKIKTSRTSCSFLTSWGHRFRQGFQIRTPVQAVQCARIPCTAQIGECPNLKTLSDSITHDGTSWDILVKILTMTIVSRTFAICKKKSVRQVLCCPSSFMEKTKMFFFVCKWLFKVLCGLTAAYAYCSSRTKYFSLRRLFFSKRTLLRARAASKIIMAASRLSARSA